MYFHDFPQIGDSLNEGDRYQVWRFSQKLQSIVLYFQEPEIFQLKEERSTENSLSGEMCSIKTFDYIVHET